MNNDKTFATLDAIHTGGAYEVRDGVMVRVEEPTAGLPGAQAADAAEGSEAGPGAVVGTTTGAPPASVEVAAPTARNRNKNV